MAGRQAAYLSFGYDMEMERDGILEAAEPLRGEILEAGTGKGYFSLTLARKGYRFTTVDISREEQQIARLHLRYHSLDHLASFVVDDGESLGFGDGTFGTVFSVNTLHHLKEPVKVLGELTRVLAPLGKLVLSDFTDKGFEMMEKIHAREGNVHDSGRMKLSEAEGYLRERGFMIRRDGSLFQTVLTAAKRS